MEAPSLQELDTLKYSELQKLAKSAGLKANVKADRLLRTLKKHFHPAFSAENSSSDSDGNSTLPDDVQGPLDDEEGQVSVSHVTLRRGRGNKGNKEDPSPEMKNKIKPVQGDNEENNAEETSVSTSKLANQQDKAQENSIAAEKTKRRRSKARRSSSKRPGSKIPKLSGVSKPGSKPSTPNFKKMHEAHFKKMESIDKYLERKQKRLDAISCSIQEVKMLTKDSEQISQKTPGSNKKKSLSTRFSLLSPLPQTGPLFSSKTPSNQRSAGKRSILVDKSAIKPSTFSSSKMNVRFSGATKDNEHKYSLVKTPARKSSTFLPNTNISEPRKSLPLPSKIKPAQGTEETSNPAVTTPFKFTAETMATPNTNKKMKFDLQASLARPLGYQPHKGKLKPWGETKENQDDAHSRSFVLKNSYKQPPVSSSREERRKHHEKGQKTNRDRALGSRRGVAIP